VVYNVVMQVPSNVINSMLKNVSDPKLRQTYADIVGGKFPFSVYCMTPQVNEHTGLTHEPGILIGYIRKDGRTIEEQVKNDKGELIAALITGRDRFDGRKGFRCECGNSSIVTKEEADIVKPGWFPNRADLNTIAVRLEKRKKKLPELVFGKSTEYDGFRVEAVA
jgi:hypothetical protein